MNSFQGVYAALVTPRRNGLEPDISLMFELLDFVARAGVNGIALFGSTGEFLHFAPEDRTRIVSLSVKRSRIPILAGVSHPTFEGALLLARSAADKGAEGIVLMPPPFFPYGQEEVKEFYLQIAAELDGAVPIFLYNAPAYSTAISCETAAELLCTGLFAGIKDSSGEWEYFRRLNALNTPRTFTFFVGNDALFVPARMAGADGVVSGCASALPEVLTSLDRAIVSGDLPAKTLVESRLEEFLAWVRRFPQPLAIREATALRGFKIGSSAVPLGPRAREDMKRFREWFVGWLPQVQKECRNV